MYRLLFYKPINAQDIYVQVKHVQDVMYSLVMFKQDIYIHKIHTGYICTDKSCIGYLGTDYICAY